jgi:hypothetical protein
MVQNKLVARETRSEVGRVFLVPNCRIPPLVQDTLDTYTGLREKKTTSLGFSILDGVSSAQQ